MGLRSPDAFIDGDEASVASEDEYQPGDEELDELARAANGVVASKPDEIARVARAQARLHLVQASKLDEVTAAYVREPEFYADADPFFEGADISVFAEAARTAKALKIDEAKKSFAIKSAH